MSVPVWAEWLIGAAAVLTAVVTIWRYVLPGLRGALKLLRGTSQLVDDYRDSGGFAGLSRQVAEVKVLAQESHHELHPNGGSSLRDSVARIERDVTELRGHASANREGISDLRDQSNDLTRRLTDVDEKADALGERQTEHRRRNDESIESLRLFIEHEHRDAIEAREALRASVTELLNTDTRRED